MCVCVCVCLCAFSRLVLRISRKGLVEGELFELHPRDKSSTIGPKFQAAWEKEMRKADFTNRSEHSCGLWAGVGLGGCVLGVGVYSVHCVWGVCALGVGGCGFGYVLCVGMGM